MTKHFEFEKMEFKNIFGKQTRIGNHTISGVATFDGENYTFNIFKHWFTRCETFNGIIHLEDYVMSEETLTDLIEGHLQWLFQPETDEEKNNKHETIDLFEELGNALKPNFAT